MALQVWLPFDGNVKNCGLGTITITNTPTFKAGGKIGSQAINLRQQILVDCPQIANKKTFSVCFWGMAESSSEFTGAWQDLCGFSDVSSGGSGGQFRWETGYSSNGGIHWHNNTTQAMAANWGPHITAMDVWAHCCVVFDFEASKVYTYTNGVLGNTEAHNGGHINATGRFWIGETNRLEGRISDFRVYDHALSAKEVKEISKGLTTHYMFNDPEIEDTVNFLGGKTCAGHGSQWALQSDTFRGSKIYRNKITQPNVGNNAGFNYNATFPLTLTSRYITLSFWVKLITVYDKQLDGYLRVQRSGGGTTDFGWSGRWSVPNWATNSANLNKWVYVTCTSQLSSSYQPSDITAWQNFYVYCDRANQGEADFACIQIENNDHATPYVNGTRQNRIIWDSSGYCHNGESNGVININEITPRYLYAANIPTQTMISATCMPTKTLDWTISFWFKPPTTWPTTWTDVFGINGTGSSETYGRMENYPTSYGTNLYGFLRGPFDGSNSSYLTLAPEQWWHVVYAKTSTEFYGYLNGVKKFTNTPSAAGTWYPTGGFYIMRDGALGGIVDWRIYSTALSEADVKELYETSMSIDSNGNILPRVLTS